jgi:hypothetical protein
MSDEILIQKDFDHEDLMEVKKYFDMCYQEICFVRSCKENFVKKVNLPKIYNEEWVKNTYLRTHHIVFKPRNRQAELKNMFKEDWR